MTVGAKLSGIQVGQNPTAANNFVITQGNDGTFKIARGNDGATTQDVLTVDASGRATLPQGLTALPNVNTAQSMVRLNTANGYGSTNTKIRRFTTVVTNQGSDITYSDSATLGASFTINTNGVYAISYSDQFASGAHMGISLNTTQPSIGIVSISSAESLKIGFSNSANWAGFVADTLYLPAGSVIRPHTDGIGSGTSTNIEHFTITRVS